jgi:hypothetical protein
MCSASFPLSCTTYFTLLIYYCTTFFLGGGGYLVLIGGDVLPRSLSILAVRDEEPARRLRISTGMRELTHN